MAHLTCWEFTELPVEIIDVVERDIKKYSNQKNFPIIPCNLCGSQEKLQRVQIKKMLNHWEKEYPDRVQSIFKSIQKVEISHLLDKNIFNFNDVIRNV